MVIWVMKIFFFFGIVLLCILPLLLYIFYICLAHDISFLYCAYLFMKCSVGNSNFLEEISSLSHSTVFLYFFALITEEGFLISPYYSLELCIQMGIFFLFSFPFTSLLFSAIYKTFSDNHFAFCIPFSWRWSWSLPPIQCHKLPSIVLQASVYQI